MAMLKTDEAGARTVKSAHRENIDLAVVIAHDRAHAKPDVAPRVGLIPLQRAVSAMLSRHPHGPPRSSTILAPPAPRASFSNPGPRTRTHARSRMATKVRTLPSKSTKR